MNTQPRGLRLLCPQGCGTTLTIPMPTLAEVNELSGDTSLKNLDTLVGRNVVGAVLVHCIYTCNAISEVHPPDAQSGIACVTSRNTTTSHSSTPPPTQIATINQRIRRTSDQPFDAGADEIAELREV